MTPRRQDGLMSEQWSAERYARHASFVPALGASILERLAPQPGERILDLGCGDGVLTASLVAAGASVLGIDASEEMLTAARTRGLDVQQLDARCLAFDSEFDAVFSNAALHWIPDAAVVVRGVVRALKPGGRFVAELGGHGNVAAIATAIRAVLARHRIACDWPWYYPSADEYGGLLRAHGLTVEFITLFPRPTPLPTGMGGWLDTFRHALFASLPADVSATVQAEIVALLAPSLCDVFGHWTADYVRLQVVARRPASGGRQS